MKHIWLAAQGVLVLGIGVWMASSSGCGAKSGLLWVPEEEEEPIEQPEPEVECEENADCDDGMFCNGEELCIDGYCEDATPVDCGQGDDCHMVYCDEDRDSCIEILIAQDNDNDGHYASPCGNDCDDSDPLVYPGAPERCNGVDDDCDREIDEDLRLECEDFGHQRCVDGEWTECLHCTVCIPGTQRFCDAPNYCSWGLQRCNANGDGWGECYETSTPSGCDFYYDMDCCLRQGACCQDYFDTDGDGDWNDSMGNCDNVVCPGVDY